VSFIDQFDELVNLLENGKKIPFSSNVIVNKGKIESISLTLKENFPSEFRKSEQIIIQRNELINQAKTDASRIIEDGKKEKARLVSQEEVYKEAVQRAKEIVLEAKGRSVRILNNLNESLMSNVKSLRNELLRIDRELDEAKRDFQDELKRINDEIMNI